MALFSGVDVPRTRLSHGVVWVSVAVAAVLVALAGGYGYHGDELYFLAAGRHLAWGYPDQPPLTPFLARLADSVAPDSLVALRAPAALAAGATVLFVGLTAREMGGGARAQILAVLAAAVSGPVLVPGHMLHTTTIDICLSAALAWLAVRVVRTGDRRLLLVAGAVLGVGLLNKYQVAVVAAGMVVGLALVGPRAVLRGPWLPAGALLALLVWSPNLLWQFEHGWPQLEMAGVISENGGNGVRLAFLPAQLLYVGPLLVPLWVAGLVRLLRSPDARPFRFLGVAWLLLVVVFVAAAGSPMYLFGAYPALLAAGGLAVDGWLRRGADKNGADKGGADKNGAGKKGLGARKVVVGVAGVASAAFIVPLALPVVPVDRLSAIPVTELNGLTAEQFGWPELARTVAGVHRALPDRERTAVVTENFGEAAALERYGRDLGLPAVHSGYRGYGDWGHPPDTATSALLVRPGNRPGPPEWAPDACRALREVAATDNEQGVDNKERGGRVWLCEGLVEPWADLWPRIRHLR
ncbi:glycosyltransferase family 39 protein [Saccharothrix sp. Mg75]|uniref:glycosyltransferase family 39 protein n=1 Tax=Saccharothrix sp. Mg75 TaxID=3445357 RepID=UPI003EEF076D